MKGFYISKISVTGINLPPAEISFSKGANVVTGASDTGKSYVFSAINYVLGRSSEPKDIPESRGYTDILMEIIAFSSNIPYTLHRAIGSNSVSVKQSSLENFHTSGVEKTVYKTKGKVDIQDHISQFLLTLCGLNNKKLLKSKTKGTTENLSFKNILQLSFISEERMITEGSPFYFSGGHFNYLKDQSLLNLILTGNDFSDVEKKEDKAVKESRINGKLEFISIQLSKYAQDRESITKKQKEFGNGLPYTVTIDKLNQLLQQELTEAKRLTDLKRSLIVKRDTVINELSYSNDLLNRFSILQKQYKSDFDRLSFILEADTLSAQIGDVVCPICTSKLGEDHFLHVKEVENFRASASEELKKINSKLRDLSDTTKVLYIKKGTYESEVKDFDGRIKELEVAIQTNFAPKIDGLKADLKHFMHFESIKNRLRFIDEEVDKLFKEKDRLEKQLGEKADEEEINLIQYTTLSELSSYIQQRLLNWNYEPNVKVNFDSSYSVFDIVISGKSRRSYGKGKRSISFSACMFGLLDFCLDKKLPFSNLIVLDSPLTTFEDKKGAEREGVNAAIQTSFFDDLADTSDQCQIIIFDNKEPNSEIRDRIHTIVFTGNKEKGRVGFFPV